MPRRRDDEGVAMLMALGLILVSSILMLAILANALGETRQTGQNRQRGTAIALAEGQVDSMISRITGSTTLPCSASVTDSSTLPDTVSIATTVTYYDTAGTALACPVPAGSTPVTGRVRAVATGQRINGTAPARRVMEAVLRLRAPVFGASLSKAIFGNASITTNNNVNINGTGGLANADLYTNAAFSCSNNQIINGSVITQSTLSMANSCRINGDAWSKSGYTAGQPGNSVGGRVLVSNGNATLANNATVVGGVRASGTISWNQCPGQCTSGGTVSPPPVEPFPQLSWNASTQDEWLANGYTNVVTNNDCTVSGDVNGPGQWLITHAATLSAPTILRTTCALVMQSGSIPPVRLNNNLAVFADGGIFLNKFTLSSTTTAQRSVYFVQPYNAVASPCAVDGIVLENQLALDSMVATLLYSPCVVRKSNLGDLTGQVYSGTSVSIDNQTNMTYVALPIYGVTNGSGGGQLWQADLLAKRESN